MTLRTCPGNDCSRALKCQRARDHQRDPIAERFQVAPLRVSTRAFYTEGRRVEIRDEACSWFVEWRQQ